MLRRTKEEVLTELPAKIEQTISCELSDEQNILYQDVLKRVRSDITKQVKKEGFASSQIHILAGLTKLRQICNHPALLLPPKKRGEYPSAKMDACMEIVEQLCAENRKVLIFSQFTSMLDILSKELKNRNIKYSYLTGQTKKRAEEVASFIADKTKPVFLISTKAGGVGLNLTVADAVIIFDPWWNPQVERQAVDRTHRIGQTKTVNVYRLRTVGTIEEKIGVLQERKQKLFNALVGDSKDLFKKLTWEDVSALLS
jgi:SNF2 family DNA or RNA helicase